MIKLVILLAITTLLSCNDIEEKESVLKYYSFKTQISPSGKFIIYYYARFGSMAFSSDIVGTEVFPIEDSFKESKGQIVNGQISKWLTNDTLLVYNFKTDQDQPKDTLPVKTEYNKVGDFIVKTIFYTTNSGGVNPYNFDSVYTKDNHIFIRILDNKKRRFISFRLGGTTIRTSNDTIKHIEVSGLVDKSMNFVYLNKDRTTSTNLPSVGTVYYDLKPSKTIFANNIQKTQIFWEK